MEEVSRLYVDANIIIHLVEHRDELSKALTDLFTAQDNGRPFLVTSELTLTELLIGPCRDGDDRLIHRYEASTWSNDQLEVAPVIRAVLWDAAVLRAQYATLKTPDAIHVSTAIGMRCSHFLTADKRLANRYELTHHRYALARGSATLDVIRPDLAVVHQLTEIASR
jgi:predicted nucleic acid-binding protein